MASLTTPNDTTATTATATTTPAPSSTAKPARTPLPNSRPTQTTPAATTEPQGAKRTISVGAEKREQLREHFLNHPYGRNTLALRKRHEAYVAEEVGVTTWQVVKNFGEFQRQEKAKAKRAAVREAKKKEMLAEKEKKGDKSA